VFKITIKGLLAHKFRFGMTALAVILGVAFLSGTLVLNDTISRTFDELFANVNEGTDASVRSRSKIDDQFSGTQRERIPGSLVSEIARVDPVAHQDGEAVVQGQLGIYAQMVDAEGDAIGSPGNGPPTFGFNWSPFDRLNPWTLVEYKGENSRAPRADNEIVIDKGSADEGKFRIGESIAVLTQAPSAQYTITGVVKFGDVDSPGGASAVLFTTAEVQRVAAAPDQFDSIAVAAASGVSQTELVDEIRAEIDETGIQVITGAELTKEDQDTIQESLSFFNTALLIFALVALFVCCFLIFNTFSIIVAQRVRELALLRAIGATGRQVLGSVLGEAVGVGVIASVIGVAAGVLLAAGLKAAFAGLGIDIPAGGTVLASRTIIVSLAVGIGVTFVSAVFPARRAARVPPIAAMRDVSIEGTGQSAVRIVSGLAVTALGVVALFVGLFASLDNAIALVGLGMVVIFLGVALLGPVIARPVSRVLGSRPVAGFSVVAGGLLAIASAAGAVALVIAVISRLVDGRAGVAVLLLVVVGLLVLACAGSVSMVIAALAAFRVEGELARENAVRNPKRTASTAAALMIGVALVALITVFAASTKKSISLQIDRAFRADYVINTKGGGFGGGFSPDLATEIRGLPDIAAASGLRFGAFEVDGSGKFLVSGDPGATNELFDLGPLDVSEFDALGPNQIAVSEKVANDKGLAVGDSLEVKFPVGGKREMDVGAIYEVGQREGLSDYFISLDAYQDLFPQQLDNQVYASLKPGVSAAAGRREIEPVLEAYPTADLQDQAEFKEAQEAQIDQIVNLIYALLALAVIIAGIGIANTLALSIVERTRELGLLRAVGMTRAQLKSTIRWEAVIISLLGTVLGLGLGLFFGWAIVEALKDQGISEFAPPGIQLSVIVLVALLLAIAAAYFPARRAAKLDVLKAISD